MIATMKAAMKTVIARRRRQKKRKKGMIRKGN